MTGKEFFEKTTHTKSGFIDEFFSLLKKKQIDYCVIGGLAVNAYTEPVVTLDLDIVIAARKAKELTDELKKHYTVKEFPNSINVYSEKSDLRIQIQTAPELQKYLDNASEKEVLGYKLRVASIEDVFKSKIAAAIEPERRESKRLKDQADLLRLIEVKPDLKELLPEKLRDSLLENRNKENPFEKIEKILPSREELENFCVKHNISYMGLFGSYAKGIFNEDSDIDILVRFSTPKGFEFITVRDELETLLGRKVDLVTEGALHHLLKDKILKDVRTIYEQK